MSSAIPRMIDAVFAAAQANLSGVMVLDGFGVTDEPGDYLMVGVDDPNSEAPIGASARQSWVHAGHQTINEEGEIVCAALSWVGETDQKAARDAAFATMAALEAVVKDDPTLGGVALWSTVGSRTDYLPAQNANGASVIVTFRISYKSYI